ncbi:MAG: zinc ribbon domain-containing protein [Saprospiraceae bacterium]
MAKKTYTIPEKLKQLNDLQTVDSKLDAIEILKGELPMEVRDLEDEITGLETRVGKLEESIAGVESEISKHETNIKEAEALIVRYTSQLDNVKNNREYEALNRELELQKLEIQLSEKRIREARTNIEVKAGTKTNSEEKLAAKKSDLESKKVELEKIIEKTEKDEEKFSKRSEKARKKIEERLLKAYDRVRSNYRNGLAVVQIKRNSCGGCFNRVPPQIQLEVQQRKKILACEHCGRVLVDDNIDQVGKKPKEPKVEA